MKIYVITRGEYSDYHIITATADKDLAEKLKKKYSYKYEEAAIEEYENAEAKLKNCYSVILYEDGTTHIRVADGGIYNDTFTPAITTTFRGYKYYISADTAEQAVKIASERHARYLYEKSEGMHND